MLDMSLMDPPSNFSTSKGLCAISIVPSRCIKAAEGLSNPKMPFEEFATTEFFHREKTGGGEDAEKEEKARHPVSKPLVQILPHGP